MKSLPPASFETFPRAWGRHQSAAACTTSQKTLSPCVEQAPSAEQAIPPDKRVTSARGANSMKIILLRNPKHVAPARGQPPRTQESPYPISPRLLRVTASAHGEPFLRVFPAHPAAGVTSYPENPSQGATPNTGHWPPRMQKITPMYSRFLRPPHTQKTLFTHLPGSPCGGYNLVHGVPFSEGHTRCRPLATSPHTRGGR